MFDDAQLLERGFFREQTVEGTGPRKYAGPMWNMTETPIEFIQPPVTFGEHNDYMYRDVLGLPEDEIEALRAGGHIATEYDASVP